MCYGAQVCRIIELCCCWAGDYGLGTHRDNSLTLVSGQPLLGYGKRSFKVAQKRRRHWHPATKLRDKVSLPRDDLSATNNPTFDFRNDVHWRTPGFQARCYTTFAPTATAAKDDDQNVKSGETRHLAAGASTATAASRS